MFELFRATTIRARRRCRVVALGGALLIAGGIASVPRAIAAQHPQVAVSAMMQSGSAAPQRVQADEPQGQKALNLADALSVFLNRNLLLVAARFDLDSVRAEELTARLRPNPELSLEAEGLPTDFDASYFQEQEIVAAITYVFELAGKRGKRMQTAAARTRVAEAQFEAAMWILTNNFKRDFYLVALTRNNLRLAQANQETFDEILDNTRQLYESGEISGLDLRRLEVEKISFDVDVANAHIDYELALRNWRLQLGGDYNSNAFTVDETLQHRDFPVSRADLLQTALANRPDLQGARAAGEAADADIRLQRAQRIPDLSLSLGYKWDFGVSQYTSSIGFSLPIFDRNQGERAKALIDKRRSDNLRRILTNDIVGDVDKALIQLQLQRQRVEAYRSGVMAGIDQIQTLTEESYRAGESSLLDLLDAVRTHRDTESAYYETLFDYQMAVLDLELASATIIK